MNIYSNMILNDCTFYDFATECAKSFIIDYKVKSNLPFPPPITDYSKLYEETLEDVNDDFNKFNALLDYQKKDMFNTYIKNQRLYLVKKLLSQRSLKRKYKIMLDKVNEFNVDENYNYYKEYMITMINDSLNFDCNMSINFKSLKNLKELTYEDWYSSYLNSLLYDIENTKKNLLKEKESYRERVSYVDNLVKLLEPYKECK